MQRIELYMQHLADQQAVNHRGQVQLNDSFYQYTLHQQRQDSSPYPWPIFEQFRATIAWPRGRPNFQARAGLAEVSGGGDGAEEDGDMADVMDFFL